LPWSNKEKLTPISHTHLLWSLVRSQTFSLALFPLSTFCSNKEKLTNTNRKKRSEWEEKKKGEGRKKKKRLRRERG
jgi:hypothetical protein